MNVQKTKKCPFCAEDINIEAIKCKHCGSVLSDSQSEQNKNKKLIIKTLTFEVSANGQKEMAEKISAMKKEGWKETNRVTGTGKYKGGKGCCLFFIFAPLAFLAGHNKDKTIVTFEKYLSEAERLNDKKTKSALDKFIKWGIIIFICFIFILIVVTAISDPDGAKNIKGTIDKTEEPKLSTEEQANQAQALIVFLSILEDAREQGSIAKYEITGAEDELVYVYISLATWKTSTINEKNALLSTFGKQWVEAGGRSLYFKDVMTDKNLGRWSINTPTIY